jgi:hypothetical protein
MATEAAEAKQRLVIAEAKSSSLSRTITDLSTLAKDQREALLLLRRKSEEEEGARRGGGEVGTPRYQW